MDMNNSGYVMPERQAQTNTIDLVANLQAKVRTLVTSEPILQMDKYAHVRAKLEAVEAILGEAQDLIGRTRLDE
jgi:hypothetical protein